MIVIFVVMEVVLILCIVLYILIGTSDTMVVVVIVVVLVLVLDVVLCILLESYDTMIVVFVIVEVVLIICILLYAMTLRWWQLFWCRWYWYFIPFILFLL